MEEEKTKENLNEERLNKKPQKLGSVISIISGKGGVGKTILASNLGYIASKKFNILLIDFDFFIRSLSLTMFPLDPKIPNLIDYDLSIWDIIMDGKSNETEFPQFLEKINNYIIPIEQNIDLLPSYFKVTQTVDWVAGIKAYNETIEERINMILKNLKLKYDFIFIDTRAGADTIGLISSIYSDIIILVTEQDMISTHGTFALKNQINKAHMKKSFQGQELLVYNKITSKTAVPLFDKLKLIEEDFKPYHLVGYCEYDNKLNDLYGEERFLFRHKDLEISMFKYFILKVYGSIMQSCGIDGYFLDDQKKYMKEYEKILLNEKSEKLKFDQSERFKTLEEKIFFLQKERKRKKYNNLFAITLPVLFVIGFILFFIRSFTHSPLLNSIKPFGLILSSIPIIIITVYSLRILLLKYFNRIDKNEDGSNKN